MKILISRFLLPSRSLVINILQRIHSCVGSDNFSCHTMKNLLTIYSLLDTIDNTCTNPTLDSELVPTESSAD